MSALLTTAHLLQIWEEGRTLRPYQVATLLVQATLPAESWATVATWTIGQRDRQLLQIREWLFGSTMESVARCPACAEQVEFSLSVRDLLFAEIEPTTPHHFTEDGYDVSYRLPTVADLAEVVEDADRRTGLIARCILTAAHHGQPLAPADLPLPLLNAIALQMGEVDPQANIQLDFVCPNCNEQWQTSFDIAQYLWQELETWARRIQWEVHLIASSYGWSEAAILQLTPARRQAYIELILENR